MRNQRGTGEGGVRGKQEIARAVVNVKVKCLLCFFFGVSFVRSFVRR